MMQAKTEALQWNFNEDGVVTVSVPSIKEIDSRTKIYARWRSGPVQWNTDPLEALKELAILQRSTHYPKVIVEPDPNHLGTTYTVRRKK
jgi:hypothetical protein